jgi:hypothetical protein
VHALEHLGTTDLGVAMWRRLCRKALRGEIEVKAQQPREDGKPIHTYTHDTVLKIPQKGGADDRSLLRSIGREVLAAILEGDSVPDEARAARIRANLESVKARHSS